MRPRAAFLNFTTRLDPAAEVEYLRWHLLDHQPEQFRLPGLVTAQRYVRHRSEASLPAGGALADAASLMLYVVGEPVQQTHDEFFALAAELHRLGRFPAIRPPARELRLLELVDARTSGRIDVAAEVLSARPHRGVVVVARDAPSDERARAVSLADEVLDLDGVVGVWGLASGGGWQLDRRCSGPPRRVDLVWVDRDPAGVMAELEPRLRGELGDELSPPVLLAPMRVLDPGDVLGSS